MTRRDAILAAAAVTVAPFLALAQPSRKAKVVCLLDQSLGPSVAFSSLKNTWMLSRLAQEGFSLENNLDYGVVGILPGAEDAARAIHGVVGSNPDAIVTEGTYLTRETIKATSGIPIVFVQVADPLRTQIVRELARPGGNVTGVTQFFIQLSYKRLELVREILPSSRRVAIVWDRAHTYWPGCHEEIIEGARRIGLEVLEGDMSRGERSWDDCFEQVIGKRPDALIPIGPWPSQRIHQDMPMQRFQERTLIPVFYGGIQPVSDPLLLQLGADIPDHYGRGASIVARILRGEKAGNISVDQTTRIRLVVNLGTARRLGIAIPKSVLLRADQVIE